MPVPQIDPRGPRPAARVTSAVLRVVLLAGPTWLLAAQAGLLGGGTLLFPSAVALALAAASLNAASGVCLGCESSLLVRKTTSPEGVPA